MKKEILKQNKGITLIALVITIIVLLILAGVAISMLSGENGILKQAAEAKTKYESEAETEEAILNSTAIQMDIMAKGLKNVTFSNGFVTGTNIEQLTQLGYTFEANEAGKMSTGAKVLKDGKQVATVVVYGDVNGDGTWDGSDELKIAKQNFEEDYQKVAADVSLDGVINREDGTLAVRIGLGKYEVLNQAAQDPNKIVLESKAEYYAKVLKESGITDKVIKVEYEEQYGDYSIYVAGGTKIEDLVSTDSKYTIKTKVTGTSNYVTSGTIENDQPLYITKTIVINRENVNIFSDIVGYFIISE